MSDRLEYEITLNRIRQELIQVDDGLSWLESLSDTDQRTVLQVLAHSAMQAGATSDDVPQAIANAKIKPTHTPAVLLQKQTLSVGISKLLQLPATERKKSFRLLMALFVLADSRRVGSCGEDCSHWWHKDLGDEHYVAELREKYRSGNL